MAVNWHNIQERVVSTFVQAVGGLLFAAAEYVAANGVADWRTAAVALGTPALLSLAKNLGAELKRDLADAGVQLPAAVPSDADRAALTKSTPQA